MHCLLGLKKITMGFGKNVSSWVTHSMCNFRLQKFYVGLCCCQNKKKLPAEWAEKTNIWR